MPLLWLSKNEKKITLFSCIKQDNYKENKKNVCSVLFKFIYLELKLLKCCQALYWSWSCSYDANGLPFIHDGWSKILLICWAETSVYCWISCNRTCGLMMMLKPVFQLFYLSGILTVFFCGIVMSHYTWHNVTESSRVTTRYVNFVNIFLDIETHFSFLIINLCRHAFATLSFISEIFIFLYVGMDALDIEKWTVVSKR